VGFGVTTFYFMSAYLALSVYYFKMKAANPDKENKIRNYGGVKY
jgi:hypothetical protein